MLSKRPLEYCFICDEPTGRAGQGDGSLYCECDKGPFCEECWDKHHSADTEVAQLEVDLANAETEIYKQMQGRRLLSERLAATGHFLRDFNDNYKKIKDKYANIQKTLDGMDDGELLKEYRNWKAIREAEAGGDDAE